MSAIRRVSVAITLALVLAGCGSSSRKPDPGPTRTCPGCGAEIIDPNVTKCPTCDYPLKK